MRYPDTIPDALLAPCGILCTLCHHHCESDDPCPGCREGLGKSKHCQECALRRCAAERGHAFCAECEAFPCQPLWAFASTYPQRYGHAFLPNAYEMKRRGKEAMLAKLRRAWTCPDCGGVICIHSDTCSSCGRHCDVPPSIERGDPE